MQDAYARALDRVGGRRRPRAPGRLADHRRPGAARSTCAAARRTLARTLPLLVEDEAEPGPGRATTTRRRSSPTTGCGWSSSAATRRWPPESQARADPAAGVRAHHGRGGARLPGERADDGGPHHPGQEEDRRGAHPVPRARRPHELPERVDAVLTVVHLVFTTGHTAPSGDRPGARRPGAAGARPGPDAARACCRATRAVAGLLALILLTDARRAARVDADGPHGAPGRPGPHPLGPAGHRRGARPGRARRCAARPPSRFALMAAIAAVHSEAPAWEETDWREVVALYDVLLEVWPSPVVALNRAVAVGFADGPAAGLAALDALAGRAPARRLRLPGRGARRRARPPRPGRGGAHRLRGGAPPHRQRGRARAARAPAPG